MDDNGMLDSEIIRSVALEIGIQIEYIDNNGIRQKSSDDTISNILAALGYQTLNTEMLTNSVEKKHRKSLLDPVKVIQQNAPLSFDLHLGVSAKAKDFTWSLITEDQKSYSGNLADESVIDNRDTQGILSFTLPQTLPIGYHQLVLKRKNRKSPITMTLIIVPKTCYKTAALTDNKKCWGINVQLYALRSQDNWGIGDFTDLAGLVEYIADCGGTFVGINPVHSLFLSHPENASPYSPSSRNWLNPIYIDVSKVFEFAKSEQAQQKYTSHEFQGHLTQARETEWVDYKLVAQLKQEILTDLFDTFSSQQLALNTERAKSFLAFVEKGGDDLLKQATFDALLYHFNLQSDCFGWQQFPKGYQDYHHKLVVNFMAEKKSLIDYYLYLQWLADEQLAQVQQTADKHNMSIGLYRDLAVGVTDCGAESWSDKFGLYGNASIGAPADALAPQGQNWGLLPFSPKQLKALSYQPFINLLRKNMQHCGALRIDHILGLMRLWWVLKGGSAKEGAYINYPADDLLGILALESHRHSCVVVGEDLGTVPENCSQQLQDVGIYSYKVFLFEKAPDGGFYSPAHYLPQSMSSVCTHDTPTLYGYWHCEDLKQGEKFGIYKDNAELERLFIERANNKQNILNSMNWHGNLPDQISRDAVYTCMDKELAYAIQLHLASGNSALLSLQLEDWVNTKLPVNIPGTTSEYPNWRRKLSLNLEDIFADADIKTFTHQLTQLRQK